MNKRSIAVLLGLTAQAASAESYRFEVNGAYNNADFDRIEVDTLALGGAFYFSRVNDSGVPLAEAAFLNKVSDLHLLYTTSEADTGSSTIDSDSLLFGGRGVIAQRWIVQGDYQAVEVEGVDSDIFSIGGGAYLDGRSSLVFQYFNAEDEFDNTDHGIALDYKNVLELANDSALNIEAGAGYVDVDVGDNLFTLYGAADFYFTPKFSLGGQLSFISEDDNTLGLGIRAQYFFNSHIAIAGAYEVDNDDLRAFTVGLTGRF